jgi:Tol biopolymer transport system component
MKNEASKARFPKKYRNLAIAIFLAGMIILTAFIFSANFGQAKLMVAYLYPFSSGIPNIWLASVDNPSEAQQLTDSKMGIYDFDVSKNGRYIAYSVRDENTRIRDIFLLDIQTQETRQLTFCANETMECYSPVFHPENTVIAYVRLADSSDELHGEHANIENIWLMDIENGESRPLANDIHFIGYSPQWSNDGNTLAFYNADLDNPSIIVYNFNPSDDSPRTQYAAPSYNGLVGTLAPDSLQLIFPDLNHNHEGQVSSYLSIADFEQEPPVFENLTEPDEPIDDISASWYPDGESVTIARRYTDSRWTRGYQLYEMDMENKEITPLLYDENYSHHYFAWDNRGEHLLVQRLPVSDSINTNSRPEIWILNYDNGELTQVAKGAYHPRWVIR